jgi:hypothetical protein
MKSFLAECLLGVMLLMLATVAAGAEELTADSIVKMHRSGAPADIIVDMVNRPDNTVAVAPGDLLALRDAAVPESVIAAVWARLPAPTPAAVPLEPNDARLVDIVRLIESGMSESIIADQIRASGQVYNLSVNDLLYLQQNRAKESTIAALMATRTWGPSEPDAQNVVPAIAPSEPKVAPSEIVFDDLVLVKKGMFGWLHKNRPGRLALVGDTLEWADDRGSSESFQFQTGGIDKVWLVCEARSSGNFCHQINFKIVKGDVYRFQDEGRDSGSNAAVLEVMETLRTYHPRLTFATPTVDD